MKKDTLNKKKIALLAIIIIGAVAACAPSPANDGVGNQHGRSDEAAVLIENSGKGKQNGRNDAPGASASIKEEHLDLQIAAGGELSTVEIDGLLFMREEEKLAGDVYRYLYSLWGSAVFENIASSEDAHTQSVLAVLNAYGVEDPARNEAGKFSNPDLQALYDQLIEQGSQSLQDALLVGAAIEEIDILDLQKRITQTGNADIIQIYENLESGSENHLRAFVRVLGNQTGTAYSPQYLTQAQYDAIISSENGTGNGRGAGQGSSGMGQGGGRGRNS